MRIDYEKKEKEWLSPRACLAVNSKGRAVFESQCPYRTVFQRDRDRIIHSKAFRRLMHKTQVFLSPEGDHYRTRLTHALEVSQIARSLARSLYLNEDLTEAIALGHDLGHTPFGHAGEAILNNIHEGGFEHRVQSLRLVDSIAERYNGQRGMNLTAEVRDGIVNHSGPNIPFTLEGQIVRLSDRIAYINHDIDDAIRAGVLKETDLPTAYVDFFGNTTGKRIDAMIVNVIENSRQGELIKMSADAKVIFDDIRKFMFENVYLNPDAKSEEVKVKHVIEHLYYYYKDRPEAMPNDYYEIYKTDGIEAVKDYIAGMTDRYAINLYKDLTVPEHWK